MAGVDRRRNTRVSRRVEVQFWQPGQGAHHGYSTNISASGMHIATSDPLPPRARLRIEVIHGERGFLVEGVVAHRKSVHPELAKVTPQGMGIRFLGPDELIRELFPSAAERAGVVELLDVDAASYAGRLPAARSERPSRHEPSVALEPPLRAAAASSREPAQPAPRPGRPASPEAAAAPGRPGTPADGAQRTFNLRFASAQDFLGVYARDLVKGSLFIVTSRPGRLQEVVSIDIYPPGPAAPPVRLAARVVQWFQPEPGAGPGPAGLSGMGVELLDPADALVRLRPLVVLLSSPVV